MSRMTLSDRIEIEAGIYARKSLSEIAEQIHKSRRYVSEELRRNATKIPGEHPLGKRCRNATGCRRGGLCGKENCRQMCYTCKEVDCQTVCKAYNDDPCKELQKPPYVCNVCGRRRKCKSDRVYYTAQQADAVAKRRYAEARNKPQMQKEDIVCDQRCVIAIHRAWRVEQRGQQILPDIPNPCCVLLQAVHDKANVFAVQLQQL